ncbi:MAG: DUF6572 domain-containing protein [Vulcanimicrobiota bacterium]
MASDQQSPIKDLLTIDMIGRRKDGGVDLGIIVSGRLTGSREDQQLLMDKVESYLKAIKSEKFQRDFNNPPPRKIQILIKCLVSPEREIVELVKSMERWVRDNNARIRLDVENVK